VTRVNSSTTPVKSAFSNTGKGSYVLIIELPEEQTITIGSLRDVHFHPGYYAYVGSAMGGLRARLDRHLRVNKRTHWHIDYLLPRATIKGIVLCQTQERVECTIARALSLQLATISRFGSGDCRCHGHLFFAHEENQIKHAVMSTTHRLGIKSRLIADPPISGLKGEN